jgi:tripartite-type tricarboxylate transporter receptor subunit TctC
VTDFAPVSLIVEVPLVLIARQDLPVSNLQEFIAYTKANQEKMTFASAGSGSAPHIGCVLLNTAMGTRVTPVSLSWFGTGDAGSDRRPN